MRDIETAITKHKYTAKYFAKIKLLRLTGLIKNNSYTCRFFSLTIDVLNIIAESVPPILETTIETKNEIGIPSKSLGLIN